MAQLFPYTTTETAMVAQLKPLNVLLQSPFPQVFFIFYYLVCEAIGTTATPGLLCQPRVIVKMIVEKQMECSLAGETEVL
jgi:hypothetical protein